MGDKTKPSRRPSDAELEKAKEAFEKANNPCGIATVRFLTLLVRLLFNVKLDSGTALAILKEETKDQTREGSDIDN